MYQGANRRILVGVALCATSGCISSELVVEAPDYGEMSPMAGVYLDQVIAIMQQNSIKRLTINWTLFRAEVRAVAPRAQTIADLGPAIEHALRLLVDGHSSYRAVGGRVLFVPTRTCRGSPSIVAPLPSTIGYVKVGSFSGTAEQALAFANGIQNVITAADHDSIAGWIVDLRGNGGGNMWPMVAGVGPVLGEDIVGYFIDPLGQEIAWEYRSGTSWSGGVAAQRVDAPYTLRRQRPKVAVLSDNGVASSGEATLIAFKKRPNTRSFGMPTCGLSTANRGFTMSDGAVLNLTVSTMADRQKTQYGDVVQPDELVSDPMQAGQRAIAWLQGGQTPLIR